MGLEDFSASETVEIPRNRLVAGLVMQKGKLLMVHNIKYGLRIEPPGGKVKESETPEEAVVRECREELGLGVIPTSLLGVYETQSPEGPFEVHMFLCSVANGELQEDLEPDKIGHFDWFTPAELRKLKIKSQENGSHLLVPNVQEALDEIIRHMENSSSVGLDTV